MAEVTESLVLDLLEWIGGDERGYAETMDAWRTSCPRLPVWEEASDRGLVIRDVVRGEPVVRLSPAGLRLIASLRGVGCKNAPLGPRGRAPRKAE